jgi:hypothetical protein
MKSILNRFVARGGVTACWGSNLPLSSTHKSRRIDEVTSWSPRQHHQHAPDPPSPSSSPDAMRTTSSPSSIIVIIAIIIHQVAATMRHNNEQVAQVPEKGRRAPIRASRTPANKDPLCRKQRGARGTIARHIRRRPACNKVW